MKGLKRAAMLTFGVALVFALASTSTAQVTTGTIYGRVSDSSGAVLPGATVTAVSDETSRTKTVVTDARGQFVLTFMPVGTYSVTIEMPGFKTRTETGLDVASGEELTVRYVMEIGAQTEQITVVSEAPLINLSSAEQDIRLTSEKVSELPVNRRDISNLLNAGTGSSSGGEGQVSLNGLPTFGFTFSVDGVDASPDSERPSLALYQNYNFIKGISMEAVKEVEVSKNIFSAEIGMTVSGNVNIISKSGTNEFHGSAFEYYQSGGLNAVNHFTSEKVSTVYHQFGASLGGPIVKDKVFFFGTYEGYRLTAQAPQTGFVPSNEIRRATTAAIPGSQPYWDLWPEPTGPSEDGLQAPFNGAFGSTQDDNHFVGRLDFNMTDSDYLTARFTRGRPNYLQPRIAFGNSRDRVGLVDNYSLTYTRVLNSTTTTELRVGFNKNETQRVDLIVPAQAVTIVVPGVPDTAGELFIKNGTNFSVENTWSTIKGNHSIKFGGLGRFWTGKRINEEQPQYIFQSVPDLLANQADRAEYQFGLEEFKLTSFDMGFFVQDDWRASSNLMLNLGIRWDYSGVPQERDGRFYNRDGPFGGAETGQGYIQYRDPDSAYDAYYGMVSPRFGFAYEVNDKTVLRGGAGIFYIPFNLFAGPVEIIQNSLGQPVEADLTSDVLQQLGIQYPASNEVARPLVSSDCDLAQLRCPTDGTFSDSSMDNERINPYSFQWTVGVSRKLTETLALDVSYVGNQGNRLTFSPEFNHRDRVTGIAPVPQGLGVFRHYIQTDTSKYHSLQTSLRRRFQGDYGFGINYTWASNTVGFLGDFTCCSRDEQPQEIDPATGAATDLSNNRGMPDFARRHRLFVDFIWELPLGDSLLGDGWRLSVLGDIQSGNSLRIADSASNHRGDRPDYSGSTPGDAVLSDWATAPYNYIDTSLFTRVDRNPTGYQSRPGTAGKRFVTGPGFWTVDMTLTKDFNLEKLTFQLRADVFNAFNKTNLSNPQANIASGSFGRITSQRGTGRSLQFAARVIF